MKIYIVKHWCDSEVLGVFDLLEKAMECIDKHKPKPDDPKWIKEEYDVLEYEINKESHGNKIYDSWKTR